MVGIDSDVVEVRQWQILKNLFCVVSSFLMLLQEQDCVYFIFNMGGKNVRNKEAFHGQKFSTISTKTRLKTNLVVFIYLWVTIFNMK